MSYVAYVLIAALICLGLTLRHDRRLPTFFVLFWIMAQPIMTWKFPLIVPGLPFQLHLNRILFLVLLVSLLPGMLAPRRDLDSNNDLLRQRRPTFLVWLFLLFLSTVLSLFYNVEHMQPKEILSVTTDIILFFLFYSYARRSHGESFKSAVLVSILWTAMLSSVVSLVQILLNKDFLRIADPRAAYGNLARTTGIFYNEYELGYFMILAMILALTCIKKRIPRLILAASCGFCVLITFHRLSYIILMISLAVYLKKFNKLAKLSLLSAAPLLGAIIGLIVISQNPDIMSKLSKSSMKQTQASIEERFVNNTVTGRFQQYGLAMGFALDNPLGIGTYENPSYYRLMAKNGMLGGSYQTGYYALQVHNGYLSVAVLYGYLSMFFFIAFCFSALRYYSKLFRMDVPSSAAPFFAVLIFMLGNVSNPFSDFRNHFILLVALLAGAFLYERGVQPDLDATQGGQP